MINRFDAAIPTVVGIQANSQAKNVKADDDFGLLLNTLVSPIQAQQQSARNLLEEQAVYPDATNSNMAFYSFATVAEDAMDINASGNQNLHTGLDATLVSSEYDAVPRELISTIEPISTTNSTEILDVIDVATASLEYDAVPRELISTIEPISTTNSTEILDAGEIATPSFTGIDVQSHTSKHSSTAAGEVELVAMPWRLQANAALSYQSVAHRTQNSDSRLSALTLPVQVISTHASSASGLPSKLSNALLFEETLTNPALQFYRISETGSALANVFEASRTPRADASASPLMWPQRVLHWLADGDATTAWVRDYQLDASGTKTLVDALRCFAEQQDFSLRRIMLNGHEVWRSPPTF